ncbi:MAG: glycoside hydrolase family protein [Terriglobia bacterium]
MDLQATMDWITRWEGGMQPKVYMDSKGHPTIGIGFNLDRPDAPAAIAALGLDYNEVRAGTQELTIDQIKQLFVQDVNRAITDLRQKVQNFDGLPDGAQMVLVDMVFNLGAAGFGDFSHMISALLVPDWNTVAAEMTNSLWYKQTGQRSQADVGVIHQLLTA